MAWNQVQCLRLQWKSHPQTPASPPWLSLPLLQKPTHPCLSLGSPLAHTLLPVEGITVSCRPAHAHPPPTLFSGKAQPLSPVLVTQVKILTPALTPISLSPQLNLATPPPSGTLLASSGEVCECMTLALLRSPHQPLASGQHWEAELVKFTSALAQHQHMGALGECLTTSG